MTKKQVRYSKAAWAKGFTEGRIVKFEDGRMILYPTVRDRDAALGLALAIGVRAEVVFVDPDKKRKS